ncbi:MAG: hypothetical protein WD021_06500 [Rhodothermales bacterium]
MTWWSVLVAACFLIQPRAALAVTPADRTSDGPAGHPRLAASERPSAVVIRNEIVYGGRLYKGREFSTFRRNLVAPAARPTETAHRTLPLDQRVEDRWIAVDKAKHVAFSFLWTLSTQYVAVNKGDLSEHRALPISVTTSAFIGVAKEYYDLQQPSGTFSRRDLVANALGILLGAGIILL